MKFSIRRAFTIRKMCDKTILMNDLIRCHEFDSDFVPLALETYGGTSEKFDKLLEKLASKAAEFNNIPYPILLNYWKKRISTVLQIGNVSVISEAYRRLFNFGAETLQRDYDLERTFN